MATKKTSAKGSAKRGIALCNLGSAWLDIAIVTEEQGSLRFLSYTRSESKGFRAGLIVHPQDFADSVLNNVEECEKRAGLRATEAHVSLACSGFSINELEESVFLGGVIRSTDIRKLVRDAGASAAQADVRPIGESIVDFGIDGRWGARSPEGLFAQSLSVRMVRQTLEDSIVINLARLFSEIGLPLVSLASSGEASGYALLSTEERDLGSVIVDIGAETCGVVIFHHGAAVVARYLTLGGIHITYDIARGLAVDRPQAEHIKIKYGNVGPDGSGNLEQLPITRWGGPMTEYDTMSKEQMNHIIQVRCREIFHAVGRVLEEARRYSRRAMVCQICGRASALLGIEHIAESYVNLPIRKGWQSEVGIERLPAVLDGLAIKVSQRLGAPYLGAISLQDHWFKRMRHWLRFQD